MADFDRGPSLLSKYVWLIETIYRAKKISYLEINEQWRENVELSRGEDLPIRTFNNWRYAIQDIFGLIIDNERRGGYHYYIYNEEDINQNGLSSWLFNTFCVGNALAGSQSIKDRILLEHVPSGQIYLRPIIEAMKENRVLNITYKSYWNEQEKNYDVQPLCVKLFRQRWYLVVRGTKEDSTIWICSLDRILSMRKTEATFSMPRDWDADAYFDGFIGVLHDTDYDKEIVKIKVAADQANYIRDLKIHLSQREVERTGEHSIFTYFLRPTFDFQQEILHYGEDVEVLEPQWHRKEMATRIEHMLAHYRPNSEE